jgi:hypothetical protein
MIQWSYPTEGARVVLIMDTTTEYYASSERSSRQLMGSVLFSWIFSYMARISL